MEWGSEMERYARMLLTMGINLEKDQELVINADLESAPLIRVMTEIAYQMGAREVHINWSDTTLSRYRYLYQSEEGLKTVHDWKAEMYNGYARRGCGYVRIVSEDPDALEGVAASRIAMAGNALSAATREAENMRMTGVSPWLVAGYPGEKWAQKVFPGRSKEDAVEALWRSILRATRADEADPVAAWEAHQRNLSARAGWLEAQQFVSFHFENALGTDFTVGMPKQHLWAGGAARLKNGRRYIPNMPTEEVFSSPDRDCAEGKLVASLPLNHRGTLIEDFSLTFHKGCVVDFDARRGKDALKQILDTDEGARRLGEIALIPADSPLPQMGLLFYSTLFDENASCHFALGRAFASSVENGENLTEAELWERGLNQSLTHVDFMVGTKDLKITGTRADGSQCKVFENGVWAEEEA